MVEISVSSARVAAVPFRGFFHGKSNVYTRSVVLAFWIVGLPSAIQPNWSLDVRGKLQKGYDVVNIDIWRGKLERVESDSH